MLNTKQMHALNHAYSITAHKSQGSQFTRIIVPIRESCLLEQTLIYTAVTRGIEQVVLVGDEQAALSAIKAPACLGCTQAHHFVYVAKETLNNFPYGKVRRVVFDVICHFMALISAFCASVFQLSQTRELLAK